MAHEADHAQKYDSVENSNDESAKQQFIASTLEGTDNTYKSEEERRVITGTEQTAARKHGEIRNDQVTRTSYKCKNVNINVSNMKPEEIPNYLYENNNQYY